MIVTAIAPIRIADVGGWTDTWFAKHGSVCNIAVYPYVEVQIIVSPRCEAEPWIKVCAENFGLDFVIDDLERVYDKMPLLECALRRLPVPSGVRYEVNIFCEVPPGASTGTSAAVSVAIIAGLDCLTPGRLTSYQIARLAHNIETYDLSLQSGIQDQLCAAFGGINFIEVHDFPHAAVSPLHLSSEDWWELERRLALVYVGRPHQSSEVHKRVISELSDNAENDPRLVKLRAQAHVAKDALLTGDWRGLAAAWRESTDVQRALHPTLVSSEAERIMEIAEAHGMLGCKVNGAGGDGGSVSILSGERSDAKRACMRSMEEEGFHYIPVYLARQGLRLVCRGD